MQGALAGMPVEEFPNVEPLEKVALTKQVKVDTPDSAPTESSEEPGGAAPTPQKAAPAAEPVKPAPPPITTAPTVGTPQGQ